MKIRDGYARFLQSGFDENAELFTKLESGQSPEVLFITCSDSRIDPALITQTLPGELFVIRNAGNLVPTRLGSGVTATIEYGVRALGVKHVIVCGHSHCGAIAGALDPGSLKELPHVAAWLRESGPDLASFKTDSDDRVTAAVHFNVLQQLDNLRQLDCVQEAVDQGKLTLHGWFYRFETGEIQEYDTAAARFKPLTSRPTSEVGSPSHANS